MSVFQILLNYLSKEGEQFKNSLLNLMKMFRDVRAPLLAGILYTAKSLEDAIRVITNCMSSMPRKERGGHPSDGKNTISVFKVLSNFLSEEGEQFKNNLKTLMLTYPKIRAPLLAGILFTKQTIKEAMRVISKTMALRPTNNEPMRDSPQESSDKTSKKDASDEDEKMNGSDFEDSTHSDDVDDARSIINKKKSRTFYNSDRKTTPTENDNN